MNEQIAVVIGATGLIGNIVVEELLNDDAFSIVRTLTRKPLTIIHPKLQQRIVNFSDMNDYKEKFGEGDIIFCCIGTTQKKVQGDKEAYKKVD
ncbi:MAG TPA: NmrA family NAD(P)-binding protein, partial [Hanamia sp.]|nr:NmrA family NAD(P)-binding protein [Hanamia sp.]